MKNIFNKMICIFLLMVFFFESLPTVIYAQEDLDNSGTASESAGFDDENNSTPSVSFLATETKEATISSLLLLTEDSQTSAKIKRKANLRKLKKKQFSANEGIDFVVDGVKKINASIKDPKGKKAAFNIDYQIKDDSVKVHISPPRKLYPGRYVATLTDNEGNIYTQDFLWGVLAINTNKAVYRAGERVDFSIAVLDEEGYMVCDADVSLNLKNVLIEETLSTKDGSISVTNQCSKKSYSLMPDYQASYVATISGDYDIKLTAKTPNGTFSIQDKFIVSDSSHFEIERESATRLFPPVSYPMNIKITANEDFEGFITETVPDEFVINKPSENVIPFSSIKVISSQDELKISEYNDIVQGESNLNLHLPYKGYFPMTQGFGAALTDSLLKKKYARFGLYGHDGVDFALPRGTPVVAADDGEVVLSSEKSTYGTTIVLQHQWGKSYYGHLSKLIVKEGKEVKKGSVIGLSGNTGLSTGPHLHFGMKLNDFDNSNGYYGKINPLPYLGLEESAFVKETVKLLTWELSLKKGETINIGYRYTSPNISPQFYTLGPLKFFSKKPENPLTAIQDSLSSESALLIQEDEQSSVSGELRGERSDAIELYYTEERAWQLAIDSQTTIDADVSVSSDNHINTARNVVFVDSENGYTFYVDSDGVCKYAKTVDGGITWASPISIDDTNQSDCLNPVVWYDKWTPGDETGKRIHIVFKDQGNDDIWYRALDTSDDSFVADAVSITSSPAPNFSNTFTSSKNRLAITKSRDNMLYVGVHDNTNSYILRCSINCASGAGWGDISPAMISGADNDLILMPLEDNNIMAIRQRMGRDDIEYSIFTKNTSEWSAWNDIDDNYGGENITYKGHISAALNKLNNHIYLVYKADTVTLGTNDDLRSAVFDGLEWIRKADIISDSSDGTRANLGLTSQSISVDENTGDIYVVYSARTNPSSQSSAAVFMRVSHDQMMTWEDASAAFSNAIVNLKGLNINMMSKHRLYAIWHDDDAAGYEPLFGDTIAELAEDIDVERLLRHGRYSGNDGKLRPFEF